MASAHPQRDMLQIWVHELASSKFGCCSLLMTSPRTYRNKELVQYPPETEEPDNLYLHQQAPWKIVHAHAQKKKKKSYSINQQ